MLIAACMREPSSPYPRFFKLMESVMLCTSWIFLPAVRSLSALQMFQSELR